MTTQTRSASQPHLSLAFSTAAALLSATFASAQVPTAELVALPGDAGITELYSISGAPSGSWVSMGTTSTPGSIPNVIYGALAGSGSSAAGILRTPMTLAGTPQDYLLDPTVLGDSIAYASSADIGGGSIVFAAWIDDTLIAKTGDPIGTSGLEWTNVRSPVQTTGGDVFLRGFARPVGTVQFPHEVIARHPAGEVIYSIHDAVPGLDGQPFQVLSFDASPNGQHWVGIVVYASTTTGATESAILLDGSLYFIDGLTPAASSQSNFFGGFVSAFVSDEGIVTLAGTNASELVALRDTWAIGSIPDRVLEQDASGRILTVGRGTYGVGASIDTVFLDRVGAGGLDVDGDGLADNGWSVREDVFGNFASDATFSGQGEVLSLREVVSPTAEPQQGIVRALFALPDESICQGEVNGIGLRASLRVLGSDTAILNDLEIRLTNLPPPSTVLPLFSRSPGFTPNPAGSNGNLCLSGPIGRGFVVNGGFLAVNLTVRAYPSQFPQPTGLVAVQPGETWYFQAWYRDFLPGGATSNFTNAVSVTFR